MKEDYQPQRPLTPDLIVSSSAQRAKMTAELFVENFDGICEDQLQLTKEFYHASSSAYLNFLVSFSEPAVDTLMFVGHNPGMEDLIERLCGDWERLPTAAVAHFELEGSDWSDVSSPVNASLKNIWRPKEIDIS